jgi:carbamoyltransferase
MKLEPVQHILGISAGFHDAAATVINTRGDIVFAGHSERYSKLKNDAALSDGLISELCPWQYDTVAWYERPWLHNLQQWYSGQRHNSPWTIRGALSKQLGAWYQRPAEHEVCFPHHLSHAAAGFQTSPYDRATVVVIDAIGEFDTISIYGAEYDQTGRAVYKRLWGQRYPHSIGLFYSAITKRVGLHPLDEEYITMGMSAYATQASAYAYTMKQLLVESVEDIQFKQNLHVGVDDNFMYNTTNEDLAGSAQLIAEELIYSVMRRAREFNWSTNLVYQGGVALNCLANRKLGEYSENIWIMPCPGDAGSSLGAAALAYGKQIHWKDAYLGHEIPGEYPVDALIDCLLRDKIVGVASGRAEFGPRALGNRSLLADPRGPDIKDRVNEIKRRQKFRPFAPVILAEHCDEFFHMPRGWSDASYMQIVARCRRPDLFPAICHVDNTSRVQTVSDNGSGIRRLLKAWYAATGCPMLLNTSLNIRGEPMVNDRSDADRFEQLYGVKICS